MPQGSFRLDEVEASAPGKGQFSLSEAEEPKRPPALIRFFNAFKEFLPEGPAGDWPVLGPKFRQQVTDVAHGIAQIPITMGENLGKAGEALGAGKPGEAVFHAAGAVPVVGPMAQQVGRDVEAGQYPEAVGHGVATLLPAAGEIARAVPPATRAVGRAGVRTGEAAAAGLKAAAPDVALGTVKAAAGAGVGSLAGEVPGMGHVARWVFAYPGARQIATGVGKGASAFADTIRGKLKAATEATTAAETAELDNIALGQTRGKQRYSQLDEAGQETVRTLRERMRAAPAPAVRPSVAPASPVAPVEAEPVEPLPESRQIAAPPEIKTEHVDFIGRAGAGENKYVVFARDPKGKTLGAVEFSETTDQPGTAYISNIEVSPAARRQGLAAKMIAQVADQYGYTNIDWGMTTEEGSALKAAMDKKFLRPIITPPPPDVSGVRAVEPRRMVVRDPATGRMKRVYTGEEAEAGPETYQEARPPIETAPAVSTAPLPRAETLKPEVAATLKAGATRVGPKGSVEVLREVPLENIRPAEPTEGRPQGNVIYPEIVRKYQGAPSPVAPELRGNEAEGYTTWEGHHRIAAAKARGAKSVLAWTPEEERAPAAAGAPRASAAIKAHGYDPASQTANIEFQSGGSYRFPDFTPEKYAEFKKAESQGQYFQKMIRNEYTRVGTEEGQPVMERNSTRLARFLNAAGISAEDAPKMGPDHWKTAAQAAGVKEPSPAIVKEAIGRLKELPAGSVAAEEFQSR